METTRFLLTTILVCTLHTTGAEEYRNFTNKEGRVTRAKVIGHEKDSSFVSLELEDGKSGLIKLQELCAEDQSFIKNWSIEQQFLSNKKLEIQIHKTEENWKSDANGLDRKLTRFNVLTTNHNPTDITGIRAEYYLYRDKTDFIQTLLYDINMDTIPSGQTSQVLPVLEHVSFKRNVDDYLNEVVGARFRFHLSTEDGTNLIREITIPENLPISKFPRQTTEQAMALQKQTMQDPSTLPERPLTEKETQELTEQYIKAFEKQDYQAWRKLLITMHPGDSKFYNNHFQLCAGQIIRIRRKDIDGRYVKLISSSTVTSKEIESHLMISKTGHIKYEPYVFSHPVQESLLNFRYLLSDDPKQRKMAYNALLAAHIPTFNYSINGSKDDCTEQALQIMDWIRKNGASHDISEPEVTLPEEYFNDLLKHAQDWIDHLT